MQTSGRKQIFEIGDRLGKPFAQLDLGFPTELTQGQIDIRLPLPGIVGRQRQELSLRPAPRQLDHEVYKLQHRELDRVAQVDRARDFVCRLHQTNQTVDKVLDIAERARLLSVAIDRYRLILQRLYNEVGNDATIIGAHPGAIRVEDSRHL